MFNLSYSKYKEISVEKVDQSNNHLSYENDAFAFYPSKESQIIMSENGLLFKSTNQSHNLLKQTGFKTDGEIKLIFFIYVLKKAMFRELQMDKGIYYFSNKKADNTYSNKLTKTDYLSEDDLIKNVRGQFMTYNFERKSIKNIKIGNKIFDNLENKENIEYRTYAIGFKDVIIKKMDNIELRDKFYFSDEVLQNNNPLGVIELYLPDGISPDEKICINIKERTKV